MSDIQGLGLVILVFSSLFTVGQLYTLRRARQSAKWPQTTGRIILSSLAPVSLTDRSFSDVQPLIRYRYSVGGTQYEGQTLSIGEGWWRSWGTKLPIREGFPVGSQVNVYYNPARPSDSALLVGPASSTYSRPIAGALLVIAGLALLLS